MRLLAGSLSALPFRVTLTGDASLSSRPMRRLVGPLGALGADVALSPEGTAPMTVGAAPLRGADVAIDVASAQVRSAFELAAIQADGDSSIDSPAGYRDHTERWLETFGLGTSDGTLMQVNPGPIPGAVYAIPGDPSSAAYVWASCRTGRRGSGRHPQHQPQPWAPRIPQHSRSHGCRGARRGDRHDSWRSDRNRVGDRVPCSEPSKCPAIPWPRAIDELPLVAVLGAYAEGITVVRDAGELRVKESDRIVSTTAMIRGLGGGAEPTEDGFAVVGTGFLDGGTVDAAGDHRIAMAGAVAATAAEGPVTITGASVAGVSWPTFYDTMEAVWSSR